MTASVIRFIHPRIRRCRLLFLAVLAVGTQLGCTREFFREWANQDVSEAVFEKSRDPRWRIDLFSIDPPAMARYADPYDPDVPPAPPDDYATQAMSPVPQWPDNRLMVPAEGTGYLDMLDAWQRDAPVEDKPANKPGTTPEDDAKLEADEKADSPVGPSPPLPPPSGAAPFAPGENPGTKPRELSPIPVQGPQTSRSPRQKRTATPLLASTKDHGVQVAAFQETGIPAPVPPTTPEAPLAPPSPPRDMPTPPIGGDPDPSNPDLSAPVNPRPDLTPEDYRASEAMGSEMAGILVPGNIDLDEEVVAGLPKGSKPYRLTMEQSFTLGLTNARIYQYNLEAIYIASLAVTLQRFAFQPQFYAGWSPQTGVAQKGTLGGGLGGGILPTPLPPNSFTYATRATGTPASALSFGTVAGVGKVFSSGAQLVMGFANSVVFNFIGKNSIQPRVQSSLPINFVQPFLRGGGRAVTLEPLTQAERSLVYQVRSFAKFRQEFVVSTLVGGQFATFGSNVTPQGFSGPGNIDPVVGFLNVVQDIQTVENDLKNLRAFEQLKKVYEELVQGESSGLSQLQVDQIDSQVQNARRQLVTDRTAYRGALDAFKIQLGMPPDVPIMLDRSLTKPFKDVFDDIDEWQRDPKRDLADLPKYADRLPKLQDINIDGRSVLGVYNDFIQGYDNEDRLEDVLLAAERVAFEHRLDLMNDRAALYDTWRQIRVTANALKGVLNVSLSNQILTPPTTTNPFGFLSQAKQFSLVINAELPLVRMAERNNFRTALINYQRQRRTLQNQEDFIKLQLRNDIRGLQQSYLSYELTRRNFVLTIRQKDQAFEQIIAPPQGGASGGTAQIAQAATQTTNLVNFQNSLLQLENTLVSTWLNYETGRLTVYRDLGTLPYDEWEAFHELFPPDYGKSDNGVAPANGPGANAGAARPATFIEPTPIRR